MKYKKYIIVLLLVLFLGCNKIYAVELNNKVNYNLNEKINTVMTENIKYENSIQLLANSNTTNTNNRSNIDCEGIFGDKNDPDSISYLLNEILQYPRIIVPILVIVFGTLDFAKAVVAGKTDEMTKAQKTFVKRCVIGVAFFFIPTIINIIMYLADIVWNGMYSTCGL